MAYESKEVVGVFCSVGALVENILEPTRKDYLQRAVAFHEREQQIAGRPLTSIVWQGVTISRKPIPRSQMRPTITIPSPTTREDASALVREWVAFHREAQNLSQHVVSWLSVVSDQPNKFFDVLPDSLRRFWRGNTSDGSLAAAPGDQFIETYLSYPRATQKGVAAFLPALQRLEYYIALRLMG
jgi:hypothetical protein